MIGKLMGVRAQARADARTIESQLHALETSQRLALQNEKLAAIGRLAAGIAHEVRNPLGVIRASASMVQEHFTVGEEAYRACDFIREEIARLNGLITSLLNFARPAELRLQPVAIEQVIDKALHLTSDELQRRGITLTRESTGTLPLVLADPDLVAQVVFGLLVNAAEAIDQNGLIIIRTVSEQNEVGVEVIDTGPGILPTDSERIFEPFFTTKPTGTGLGLPMAVRIVQAHGGTIEVVTDKNVENKNTGARFRIRLPLRAGSGTEACCMKPQLLILDDEQRMVDILAMVLRREGYEVQSFIQPASALEALRTEPFDLLLTDLKMPGADGLTVLRDAKTIDPELPVILITAHATVATAIAAIREGAFDYVEKPFDNDELKTLVHRALDVTRLARENRSTRELSCAAAINWIRWWQRVVRCARCLSLSAALLGVGVQYSLRVRAEPEKRLLPELCIITVTGLGNPFLPSTVRHSPRVY